MSNQDDLGKGGSPYKPSARKGIHSHENCPFSNHTYNMGRYGLKKKDDGTNKEPCSQDQGVDEVDNIMSKLSHSSPLQMNQKTDNGNGRRYSLNTPDYNLLDNDSDCNMLAKSLPANMPSYYCSDEFAHQSLPNDFYKIHNSISQSPSQTISTRRDFTHNDDSFGSRSSDSKQEYELSMREPIQQNKNSFKNFFIPFLGIIGVVSAVCYSAIVDTGLDSINVYNELKFNKDMNYLGDKYKINSHSILELQTGISTISEKNDTGSFIFLYNSNSVQFDQIQFSNFMEDIALTAAKYLRNGSSPIYPTIVQSSQLNMKTHSELMNRYRNEVSKTGVMLVKDIDGVPSSLAMAFHYFCDEYNPLVAKTAIFFTLNLDKCLINGSDKRSTYTDIEKCLENKWNTVPKDNIRPLLARVVNVVVDLSGIS